MRTIIIVLLACLIASPAGAQAPQTTPTADQLFARVPAPTTNTPAAGDPIAVLRFTSVVTTPTALIYMYVNKNVDQAVRVAGRVWVRDENGRQEVLGGHAFFASRDMSLTSAGPGYFPKLAAAAVIPVADVSAANFGKTTIVQVGIFDAETGGLIFSPLPATFVYLPPPMPKPWKDGMACSAVPFTCTAGLPGGALSVSCSKPVPNTSRLISIGNGLCVNESLCEEITQSGSQTTTGGTTGLIPDCSCQFVSMTSQLVQRYPGGTTWREQPPFACGK